MHPLKFSKGSYRAFIQGVYMKNKNMKTNQICCSYEIRLYLDTDIWINTGGNSQHATKTELRKPHMTISQFFCH